MSLVTSLKDALFSTDRPVYGVLDGASAPGLLPVLVEAEAEFFCLLRGELPPDLAEAAPYLVRLHPDDPFTDWALGGWGRHWGIYAQADADLREMRKHCRAFTVVHDPDARPLFFRYYDPRVLRRYLPTCDDRELDLLFGPVDCYLMEGEDPATLVRFFRPSGHPDVAPLAEF